jgi:hypothetical protein
LLADELPPDDFFCGAGNSEQRTICILGLSLSGPHHRNRLIPDDRFSEQIPEIVRRLRMRYLLGFHVEPSQTREFHPIDVRLTADAKKRYPNAIVRARRGYYTELPGQLQVSKDKARKGQVMIKPFAPGIS